ncbi:immunity 8 family protein [Kribbella sp. NBC_01510]|uniref:Imm8 family immunity protein n=1 Tax=Kribbella sp. NBC_01510 TaxID=2903581 RepID=UPI003867B754
MTLRPGIPPHTTRARADIGISERGQRHERTSGKAGSAACERSSRDSTLIPTLRRCPASEESFDVTVCSPEWLAKTCREVGGIYDARHHLVVNLEDFDVRALCAWLAARVQAVEAESWSEIGERLGRLGYWEFEDYRP